MGYFKSVRREAWKETWELVLESPLVTVLLTAGIFVITVFFSFLWKEKKDVIDLLTDGVIGVLSTAIVFCLVFLFHFFFMSPKKIYDEKNEELAAEKEGSKAKNMQSRKTIDELTEELATERNSRPVLGLTFCGPEPVNPMDRLVGAPTYRIRLRNQHRTATARNVRVHLKSIESQHWTNGIKPPLLHKITAPNDFILPLAGAKAAGLPDDIYPETEQEFDLLFVQYGLSSNPKILVGMAPFVVSSNPATSFPSSAHGYFDIGGLLDEGGRLLTIEIYVTCDSCETTPYKVDFKIPSLRENGIPRFVAPAS